jgi:DNA-binding NarL/FixJ family response regulator
LLFSIRVLVVDDYKDWRRQVCLLLQSRPELKVIYEASDGPEAVQKAEEVQPDLVLLDINLPKLNGIEAARRIRNVSPDSKIIFLSLHSSLEVVQVALSTGALGYVYKMDSRRELLPAMDAALLGKQFVSSSLKGCKSTDIPGEPPPHRHEVLFYSDDTVFLDHFARFITVALKAGAVAVAFTTKTHRDSLVETLKAQGWDVDAEFKTGRFIAIDVADMLSTIMVNDLPDPALYFQTLSGFVEAAAGATTAGHPRIALCGEGTSLLLAEGRAGVAIRFEKLCTELATTHGVDILCGFPLESFHSDEDNHMFESISAEHSTAYSQ